MSAFDPKQTSTTSQPKASLQLRPDCFVPLNGTSVCWTLFADQDDLSLALFTWPVFRKHCRFDSALSVPKPLLIDVLGFFGAEAVASKLVEATGS